MDFEEYEKLPTNNFLIHLTAGAVAGVMEHCVMYPLDSVKTRMQSLSPHVNTTGIWDVFKVMVKQEGILRPFRGMSAVIAGAGPAHALYFSCYEYLKENFQAKTSLPLYFVAAPCGIVATLIHDGVMTPTEVVKQRLQMYNSPYKSLIDCVKKTSQTEGLRAFYRSYTTQLTMNIPFQSIHFMTYECCQSLWNKEKVYNPLVHMVSGAIAGGFASAITTPLDVVKTLLNTQQHKVVGMVSGFKTVYRLSGFGGYFKGLKARVFYQMPSTAICWSVYELFKYLFKKSAVEVKCTDKSIITPTVLVSDKDISNKLKTGWLLVVPEVNLEPSTELNYVNDSTNAYDYESRNSTNNNKIPTSISDQSAGNYKIEERSKRFLSDKIERTHHVDKTERNSSILSGTGIFGPVFTFNTMRREDEKKSRSELLDVTHS